MNRDLFLVTGANGFVASNLVELLIAEKKKVRAMIRNPENAKLFAGKPVEVVIGDMKDPASLKKAVEGVGGVYHIAAVYRQADLPEDEFFRINTQGTKDLLDLSIEAGVERFVHCSTGGVLGHVNPVPGTDKSPYAPGDMYQRSKTEAEKIVLEYTRGGKIRGAIIRPAMVYGPGDTRHYKMFKMIQKGTFFYVGKGMAWCHFVDVRDLVRAFYLAMTHEDRTGEIYCVPGKEPRRLKEAVKEISKQLNVSEPWLHLPVVPMQLAGTLCELICKPFKISPPLYRRRVDFFVKDRNFDRFKAEREIGYVPRQDFKEEVQDMIKWYREHGWLS